MGNKTIEKQSRLFIDELFSFLFLVLSSSLFFLSLFFLLLQDRILEEVVSLLDAKRSLTLSCRGERNPPFHFSISNTMAYSINARKTNPIHIRRYRSTLFNVVDVGAISLAVLKVLTRIKKIVTSNPMRPGITSGWMMKDAHETTTNNIDIR